MKRILAFQNAKNIFSVFFFLLISSLWFTADGQTAISGTLWGGQCTNNAATPSNFTPLPGATAPGTTNVVISQWNRGSGIAWTSTGTRYNSNGWLTSTTTLATAFTANDYVYFTITNNAGVELKVTGIGCPSGSKSTTGPPNHGIYYKTGTGTAQAFSATTVSTASWAATAITGAVYICPGQTTTFYVCGWGGTNTSGTWSPDGGTSGQGPTISASYVTGVTLGTTSSNTPVCSGTSLNLTGGTLTGGVAPLTYSWSGPGSYTSTSQSPAISGVTTAAAGTYTYSVTDAYTCVYTGTATVSVTATPTITGTPTTTAVCASTNTTVVANVTGASAYTWQRSTAAAPGTFTTISSATVDAGVTYSGYNSAATLTLTSPQTTVNGYNYELIASTGTCSVTSAAATLTINSCGGNSITTTAATYGPFCNSASNNISVAFTSTGSFTGTFSVQLSSSSGSFSAPTVIGSGTSPITATIPSGTAAGNYRVRVVNSAPSINGSDNGVDIVVSAPSVGGTVAGSQAICTGATPSALTLSGNTGSILYWQSSANTSFTSPTTISTTVNPLPGATIGAIGSTTYYNAVVQNGTCVSTTSGYATITVNPLPTMGTIAGLPTTLCTGTPATLTCTPNSGSTYSWTSSNTAVATINSSTGVANAVLDGSTNVVYSYTNTATGCANTTSVSATVATTPSTITATPSATVLPCGANAALLTASGGSVISRTATFSSGAISVLLPTSTSAGISTINTAIPAGAVVTGVSVTFNTTASSAYYSDLLFNLKAPNGQILNLFDYANSGPGSAGNFSNIVVSSAGAVAFSATTAPTSVNVYSPAGYSAVGPTGYPSGSGITFSSLYSTPSGIWTFIGNDSYSGTASTLTGWSIALTYTFPVTYTWTPNGSGSGLYTNSGATTPYSATSSTTVYALPATGTSATYTVTSSNNGCAVSATAAITANACTGATITSEPVDVFICASGSTSFSVTASGIPAPAYQWQRKSPTGTFTDITSASFDGSGIDYGSSFNTGTLSIAAASASFNGYSYRCVVTNTDGSDASTAALLNVAGGPPATPTTPTGTTSLVTGNVAGLTTTSAGATGYIWQRSTPSAPLVFSTITNGAMDAGVTYSGYNSSATLTLTIGTTAVDGYAYQVVASNACGYSGASSSTTISVNNAPAPIVVWDFSGTSGTNWGASPYLTSTGSGSIDAHLTTPTGGFLRGSSVVTTGSTASGGFGGSSTTPWVNAPTTTTSENYGFCFGMASVPGYYISATSLNSATRRSGTGPTGCTIYYSIDSGTTYTWAGAWTTTSSSGTGGAASDDLTSLSALQNVTGTKGIRFKILPSGATSGNWYLMQGFNVTGSVNCRTPIAYNLTGSSCTGSVLTLSGSDTWCSYQLKADGTNIGTPVTGTGSALTFSGTSVAGTYSVVATNIASGCIKTATMNGAIAIYAYPATPSISISGGSSPFCTGGSVTFSTADVAGATYQWYQDGSAAGTSNTYSTSSALSVGTHTYSVSVSNAAGCTAGSGSTMAITVDPAVSLGSITATSGPMCVGSVINVSQAGSPVSATTGSMVYTWYGPAGIVATSGSLTSSSSTSITALSSVYGGVYSLSATFSEPGCTVNPVVTGSVTVVDYPATPVVSITSGNAVYCLGSSVTLGATSPGGVSYQWYEDGTAVATTATYNNATTLLAGTHTYSVSETTMAGGCASGLSGGVTITIDPMPALGSLSANHSINCTGATVTLQQSGGNEPTTGSSIYTWVSPTGSIVATTGTITSPFNSDYLLSGTSDGGTYSLSASYSEQGCTVTPATLSVTVNSLPVVTGISLSSDILCVNSNISLTAMGFSGSGSPISYNWVTPDAGSVSSGSSADFTYTVTSSFSGAIYSVSVTYPGNGCTSVPVGSAPVTVNAAPQVTMVTTTDNVICLGGNFTLSATVDAEGGEITGYRWSGPYLVTNTTTDASTPSLLITPSSTIESGLYSVVATTSGTGCTSPATVISVSVTPTPVPVIVADDDVCLGSAVVLSGASSTNAVAYFWEGPGLSAASGITVSATPPVATSSPVTYSLTVSGGPGSGCSPATLYTKNILVDYLPEYTVAVTPERVCIGGPVLVSGSTAGSTTSSGEPATFSWSGPSGFTSTLASDVATPVGSAIYTLTVTSGACVQTVTTVPVTVDPIPVFTVSATPTGLCTGGVITLNVAASGLPGSGSAAYVWSGPGGYTSTLSALPGTTLFTTTSTANSGIYTLTGIFSEQNCGTSVTTSSVSVTTQALVSVSLLHPGYLCVGDEQVVNASVTGGSGIPIYSWTGPGIVGTATSGSNTYSVTPVHAQGVYTVGLSFTGGAGCNTVSATSSNFNSYDYPVWLGNTSNDWTVSGNWLCGNVPSSTDSVLILSGRPNQPVLASGTGNTKTLQLASGATVGISMGAQLNVSGNLVNNGIISGNGLLNLNGSMPQAILGNGWVGNIQLSNAAGDSIGAGSSVTDTMTVTGQMKVATGNFKTKDRLVIYNSSDIVSGPNVTGMIGQINSGAAVTGNVIMQQYMSLSHRAYVFWGHPFTDTIALTQLERYIDITGSYGSGHGFTATATNSPSAYWYDTHHSNSGASGGDPGWIPFNWCIDTFVHTTGHYSASDTNMVHPYQGFRWYFRGSKGQGLTTTTAYVPDPAVVRQWGHVNQGDVDIPLQRGPQSTSLQAYNQISNPYPSPVDIGAVLGRSSGNLLTSHFYVWYAAGGAGGIFRNYDLATTTTYVIEENTSFQIQSGVADGSQSLHFHETDKAVTPTEILLKANPGELALNVYDSSYHIWDFFSMKFSDDASDEFEYADGGKPVNPDLNFYSWSSNHLPLADDRRPFSNDKIVPLGITSKYLQHFILRVDNYAVPEGGQVYLHDKYLGTYTLLTQGTEYGFDITKEAGSQGDNRFELGLRTGATVAQTASKLQVLMVPNPATSGVNISYTAPEVAATTVRLMTVEGVCVLTQELGPQQSGSINLALDNLAAGIYMVAFTSGKDRVVQRLVKE